MIHFWSCGVCDQHAKTDCQTQNLVGNPLVILSTQPTMNATVSKNILQRPFRELGILVGILALFPSPISILAIFLKMNTVENWWSQLELYLSEQKSCLGQAFSPGSILYLRGQITLLSTAEEVATCCFLVVYQQNSHSQSGEASIHCRAIKYMLPDALVVVGKVWATDSQGQPF